MKIEAMQWNIGGGKIATKEGAVRTQDASYDKEDLDYIENRIKLYDPDIITLQEVHSGVNNNQAEEIANVLGYDHLHVFSHSVSHMDPNYELSLAIISRFPASSEDTVFQLLSDPQVKVVIDGEVQDLHSKGVTVTLAELGKNQKLQVVTTHLHAFRRCNIPLDSPCAKRTFAGFTKTVGYQDTTTPCIAQGDFNIDNESLKGFFPFLFQNGFDEVLNLPPTSPWGSTPDHVLYRRVLHQNSIVDNNVLTDHFPIISTFETVS